MYWEFLGISRSIICFEGSPSVLRKEHEILLLNGIIEIEQARTSGGCPRKPGKQTNKKMPRTLLESQKKSLLAQSICALSVSVFVPQHPDFSVTCSFPVSFLGFIRPLSPRRFCLTFTMVANTKPSIHLINILLFSSPR